MGVFIRIAKTPKELDELFQLRHRVFAEQDMLAPLSSDGRLANRFDAFPSTVNLMAEQNGVVAGGLRLTRGNQVGDPAQVYYDFGGYIDKQPLDSSNALFCSMLCVDPAFRGQQRLIQNLLLMTSYYAYHNGVTHLMAPVRPTVVRMLKQVGFRQIAETFTQADTGLVVCPMVLALQDLSETHLRFIQNQKIHQYTENFERAFFEPGETVIHSGDSGREAYYIVDGDAEVFVTTAEGRRKVNELGPGDLFGELALLTETVRSADVVASSPLDTMVLNQNWFESQIMNNLDHVSALLRLMGGRLKTTLCQLN